VITVPSYAGGLYWRKSKWNGLKCLPVILSLDAGRLRLAAAKEVAFDVPCADVVAKFTKFGTLVLTVGRRSYDILGVGASLSPSFTKEQREELQARQAKAANAAVAPGVMAAGTGIGGEVGAAMDAVAIVGAVFEIKAMRENIKPWRDLLPAAGVRVTD
jgi:hypothetical protein